MNHIISELRKQNHPTENLILDINGKAHRIKRSRTHKAMNAAPLCRDTGGKVFCLRDSEMRYIPMPAQM